LLLGLLAACGPVAPSAGAPSTPTVYRQSLEEFAVALRACIADKGYDWQVAVVDGSLSIHSDTGLAAGDAQLEREAADLRACIASIDPARLEPPTLTDDQVAALYRYAVAQAACMRAAGYPVDEPPPIEVFRASGATWEPYGGLLARGVELRHDDVLRCQRVPERPSFVGR